VISFVTVYQLTELQHFMNSIVNVCINHNNDCGRQQMEGLFCSVEFAFSLGLYFSVKA
jgi:hypothetical protein